MEDSTEPEGIVDQPNNQAAWDKWHRVQVEHNQRSIDSSSDSFDKSMLTLSSGALGVSLAFIKDIVPLGRANGISLLLISWVAFALCIVVTVFSFRFSIAALKKHRDFLDKSWSEQKLSEPAPTRWPMLQWCNRGAIAFFLVGLICTMIFVGINVVHFHGADTDKSPETSASTNVRNYYMSGEQNGKTVEKVVGTQGLLKARVPMKTLPAPAVCPVSPTTTTPAPAAAPATTVTVTPEAPTTPKE